MAKVNTKARVGDYSKRKDVKRNYEGGLSFQLSPEMELFSRTASCFWNEPRFYDETKDAENEIFSLVDKVALDNPEFPLQLSAYLRNVLNMRTVSLALLVKACKNEQSRKFVKAYTPSIVKRADELAEVVAFYKLLNGDIGDASKKGMLSNPLKRGLANSFYQFDEYQFAKYDRDGEVKLKDVLKIVHPKPRSEAESQLFGRIRDRTLKVPDTWETYISVNGSTKENWETILPKMPFMARLRNLRNLMKVGADVSPVLDMLKNMEAVKKSKQFPYRFYSAHKELTNVEESDKVLDALETALNLSVFNIPELKGKTFVASDNSGSMEHSVSKKSTITLKEIANLSAAILHKRFDNVTASVFGDDFAVVPLQKTDSILANTEKLTNTHVGYSTYGYKAIQHLLDKKKKVDRVIIFTDMELYNADNRWGYEYDRNSVKSMMDKYRASVNPNVYLYVVNLASYGDTIVPENDPRTCLLSGWSDKILEFIPLFENKETVLEEIKKVKPEQFKKPITR